MKDSKQCYFLDRILKFNRFSHLNLVKSNFKSIESEEIELLSINNSKLDLEVSHL